ncbi:hypothetical protein GCM10010306_098430 [Streptomyces umbrinus]|nr:hypothetical protein GCM10010306_098430 [Streptomyces umbrinus]
MVFTEPFDATVMSRFLDRLAGHVDRRTHHIVNQPLGPPVRTVRGWPANHADRVELYPLPPHSPD